MAFGFPPSFSKKYNTQIDDKEVIAAFKNIITQLGWKIKTVTEQDITCATLGSATSWKENLTVKKLNPGTYKIESKSSFQVIDYGINEENVNLILDLFIEFEKTNIQNEHKHDNEGAKVNQDTESMGGKTKKSIRDSDKVDVKIELENLKEMVNNELITQDDYELKKKELLGL
tara:strand:+ start:552 stop:1070 length:519 start_codon:yes stop_codon:yes gene_type:complete